ncbi:MAG: 16S rRNA (uracil(1498)-N(3))-methyltransferase [Pseudomonadota bacterium]
MNGGESIKARLYVPAPLEVPTLGLDAARAHYLRHVLRLEAGDRIALFDGRTGEYAARIDGFGKGWCTLALLGKRRDMASELDLWLVFAPIKRARLDFLVEKATELGVSALWPVFTQHTALARVNVERLEAIAIEAAERCQRLSVPAVFEPKPFAPVIAEWTPARRVVLLDDTGGGEPIADALVRLGTEGPFAILTGPEGGFARAELDALRKLPFVSPVGLGPRVLRADTAALAGLAIFQALAREARSLPPRRFPQATST